jgi:hypothetical protein
VRLGGHGILVGEDSILPLAWRDSTRVRERLAIRVDGAGTSVDGRNDGEEVLVSIVIEVSCGNGFVEGIEKGRIMRPEGEFGDEMGEVEDWWRVSVGLDDRREGNNGRNDKN